MHNKELQFAMEAKLIQIYIHKYNREKEDGVAVCRLTDFLLKRGRNGEEKNLKSILPYHDYVYHSIDLTPDFFLSSILLL